MKKCQCGKPLHYSDKSIQKTIQKFINDHGEYIDVICLGNIYKISRHYIALHGIKASELDSLGFEPINKNKIITRAEFQKYIK